MKQLMDPLQPTEQDLGEERKQLTSHMASVLREARKRTPMTQSDVAERVGVVTEVLGRMERGNMLPSVPTLRRLCVVLRLDANALLGLLPEGAPTWLPPAEPGADVLPELRRLVRSLRRLDAEQLLLVHTLTVALLKYVGQKPEEPGE